ncbi:MAG TPA: CinA family nicotinamide mononucleotide deamidase-related protein [Candidatus Hydrogenedentes bacterium]|nr:CinA family nicotinamide mononucleotide deamidase-related protein [Candidatus Hydrogenedentota bacterium]HRK35294.1 CinA family nicotinamide mononucleotide deamidase-related protein [Candidatus Hydrogenedentota bacterium]
MNAEIVMIGTELLLGQIVDSNATHIGRVLAENGIGLYQKTTVGDNRQRIAKVLELALERADVVLTSGGLGPTEDDLTREAVSDVFGRPLEFRQDVWDEVMERFAFVRRPVTENNKKQALAPEGARIITNPNGTAPGIICGDARGEIICMPGVPRELFAMLADSVIPYLREKHGMTGVIHQRVLKVCGVGESWVDSKMGDLMATLSNPQIGVLASAEWVRIRISAKADTIEDANRMIDEVDAKVRERMPGLIMGTNDDTIEGVLDALFAARGWRVAVSETFTGGMIAQRLTVARATCFAGALVEPIRHNSSTNGAHTAIEAARRACEAYQSECGLGVVTNPETSTVYGAFVAPDGVSEWELGYGKIDALMQTRTAVHCLERMRRYLTGVLTR